ncbi:hemophore-related protein [Antrihabitans sp. YC3-6]|uniref:Hemophore-related protein n=1 Tax=Antrihabitans stalagmiti TaxID=2799499 RepID=A0A934NSL5_9NOCA|nr:hemophore-related protein [Antrihabitans stalagmiti]MBJ8340738.1 hemophore-related protein [Antrihabitans stalagmiti]
MKSLKTTLIGAMAGGVLLFAPTTASAVPTDIFDPLLDSTCNFGQIDAALHDRAPEVAAQLDQMPEQKAQLAVLFDLPVDQRRMAIDAYLAANPGMSGRAEQLANSLEAEQARPVIQSIADSCSSY